MIKDRFGLVLSKDSKGRLHPRYHVLVDPPFRAAHNSANPLITIMGTLNPIKTLLFAFQWSFGVVIWELTTLAQQPYPEIDPFEMGSYLVNGYRLSQPVGCPDEL